MVTSNVLFAGLVSVPANVAEPVVVNVPAAGPTLKFTVTNRSGASIHSTQIAGDRFPWALHVPWVELTLISTKLLVNVEVKHYSWSLDCAPIVFYLPGGCR